MRDRMQIKPDVPQVREESGLSMDYLNEFLGPAVINNDNSFIPTLKAAVARNGGVLVRPYEARFSHCGNVVTDKNRHGVAKLNAKAAKANEIFRKIEENPDDIAARAKFKDLMGNFYDEARAIMRGETNL